VLRRLLGAGLIAVGGAVAVSTVYLRQLREPCLTWGATDEETVRAMPGDDLLPVPELVTTRAIGIDAPARDVWPWLVQMGPGRGGAYTYDWVENLARLDMHSADRIHPEWQQLEVGDVMALGAKGPRMRVQTLEPERALVYATDDHAWVWAFGLYPEGDGTRLVSRNRIDWPKGSRLGDVGHVLMEPGSLLMERKMLLGIKERAERVERVRPKGFEPLTF
jgi:hypothetical protein